LARCGPDRTATGPPGRGRERSELAAHRRAGGWGAGAKRRPKGEVAKRRRPSRRAARQAGGPEPRRAMFVPARLGAARRRGET